ncbi:bifunctional metallophosphatase/5'-nucleotidase [Angustibacter aerolatus]
MSRRPTRRRPLTRATAVVGLAALAVALPTGSALAGGRHGGHGHGGGHGGHGGHGHQQRTTDIQLLSFNDLHGNLEPPSGSSGRLTTGYTESTTTPYAAVPTTVNAGGTEYLATHLQQARKGHRDTVTAAAGDLVGASPLLSAAFHDEPTVEAMNALGLDVTSVGNHEFDEGYKEIQRLARGGCIDDGDGAANQNSCADHTFRGARYPILAANVKYAGTNKTILPPYWIKTFKDGAKIGFIGMTLKDTPSIVTKSGIEGLQFTDEAQTANALVPVLKRQGVKAIVVLVHQGGDPATTTYTAEHGTYQVAPPYDATCSTETKQGVKGAQLESDSAILDITRRLDPQIDMVVSGHTHQPYVCSQADSKGRQRLITSASSFGRLYTETNLTYDLRKGDIVRSSVEGTNVVVSRDVAADPRQSSIISTYKRLVQPIQDRVLGQVAGAAVLPKPTSTDPDSTLGRLIADAQLADPSVAGGGTPQIAFMNPGGIRGDLTPGANGDVTYGQAFAIQPFSNYLVSMDLKGSDVLALLEQQFADANAGSNSKVLQVSDGFTYTYSASAPAGSKVVAGSVKLHGTPIDPAATYRVVANNFLSDGGDNFAAFTNGTNKIVGGIDIDGFAAYLSSHSPYTPVATDRITTAP